MKVAIHQPHFLPWLGYLHRMAQADLFVLLDHVQFERRNYQNRTMIRLADQGHWLTVPVVQNSQKERIVDKLVDNRLDGTKWWSANHFATLRHAYRAAPFFDVYAQSMQRLFETNGSAWSISTRRASSSCARPLASPRRSRARASSVSKARARS